jgi:hypothetical protein
VSCTSLRTEGGLVKVPSTRANHCMLEGKSQLLGGGRGGPRASLSHLSRASHSRPRRRLLPRPCMRFTSSAYPLHVECVCASRRVCIRFTSSVYPLHVECVSASRRVCMRFTSSVYALHVECVCASRRTSRSACACACLAMSTSSSRP